MSYRPILLLNYEGLAGIEPATTSSESKYGLSTALCFFETLEFRCKTLDLCLSSFIYYLLSFIYCLISIVYYLKDKRQQTNSPCSGVLHLDDRPAVRSGEMLPHITSVNRSITILRHSVFLRL